MALPSARRRGTRQRVFEKKIKNVFAECPNYRHSAKAPLTAAFLYRAQPLALGKGFAECPTNSPREKTSLPLIFFLRALC